MYNENTLRLLREHRERRNARIDKLFNETARLEGKISNMFNMLDGGKDSSVNEILYSSYEKKPKSFTKLMNKVKKEDSYQIKIKYAHQLIDELGMELSFLNGVSFIKKGDKNNHPVNKELYRFYEKRVENVEKLRDELTEELKSCQNLESIEDTDSTILNVDGEKMIMEKDQIGGEDCYVINH